MSYDKWCRSFCRRHCEKSLSLVCSLVMEVEREERQSLMAETREEKNSVANVGEPVRALPKHEQGTTATTLLMDPCPEDQRINYSMASFRLLTASSSGMWQYH